MSICIFFTVHLETCTFTVTNNIYQYRTNPCVGSSINGINHKLVKNWKAEMEILCPILEISLNFPPMPKCPPQNVCGSRDVPTIQMRLQHVIGESEGRLFVYIRAPTHCRSMICIICIHNDISCILYYTLFGTMESCEVRIQPLDGYLQSTYLYP